MARVHTLPIKFFDRGTKTVARKLLGMELRVRDRGLWRSGAIVETEAYVSNDPANHAFRGPNRRNRSMFNGPGTVYVYSVHGVYCVNSVTRRGEAVLIRALQPLENVRLPTNGPGRLCRALHITKKRHDGLVFTGSKIQIVQHDFRPFKVSVSRRVGVSIAREKLLRFFVRDNPNVSK